MYGVLCSGEKVWFHFPDYSCCISVLYREISRLLGIKEDIHILATNRIVCEQVFNYVVKLGIKSSLAEAPTSNIYRITTQLPGVLNSFRIGNSYDQHTCGLDLPPTHITITPYERRGFSLHRTWIVCSTACSCNQKYQSFVLLILLCVGSTGDWWIPLKERPVMQKAFSCHDVCIYFEFFQTRNSANTSM